MARGGGQGPKHGASKPIWALATAKGLEPGSEPPEAGGGEAPFPRRPRFSVCASGKLVPQAASNIWKYLLPSVGTERAAPREEGARGRGASLTSAGCTRADRAAAGLDGPGPWEPGVSPTRRPRLSLFLLLPPQPQGRFGGLLGRGAEGTGQTQVRGLEGARRPQAVTPTCLSSSCVPSRLSPREGSPASGASPAPQCCCRCCSGFWDQSPKPSSSSSSGASEGCGLRLEEQAGSQGRAESGPGALKPWAPSVGDPVCTDAALHCWAGPPPPVWGSPSAGLSLPHQSGAPRVLGRASPTSLGLPECWAGPPPSVWGSPSAGLSLPH